MRSDGWTRGGHGPGERGERNKRDRRDFGVISPGRRDGAGFNSAGYIIRYVRYVEDVAFVWKISSKLYLSRSIVL